MSNSPIGVWKNCGTVLHSFENPDGEIYIIYGAGERYVFAAKVNKKTLLEYLEKSDNSNPFVKSP